MAKTVRIQEDGEAILDAIASKHKDWSYARILTNALKVYAEVDAVVERGDLLEVRRKRGGPRRELRVLL